MNFFFLVNGNSCEVLQCFDVVVFTAAIVDDDSGAVYTHFFFPYC